MQGKISDKVEYLNRVRDNVSDVKPDQIRDLYNNISSADCLLLNGAGRSLYSLRIAASKLAKNNPGLSVITPEDVGFPDDTTYGALPKLEKMYEKISIFTNSGSGETETPLSNAEQVADYIESTKTDKFTIDVITSKPDSPIGKLGKRYGSVLELKGRDENLSSKDSKVIGIMGDIYELGSLVTGQSLNQMLCEKADYQKFYEIIETEFPMIGNIVDNFVMSETYDRLIDHIESRAAVHIGGRGVSREDAKMLGVRLSHIKHFLGDQVHIIKSATDPPPRAMDVTLITSKSGGKQIYPGEKKGEEKKEANIVSWAKKHKNLGAKVFSLVGTEGSPLERESDYSFNLLGNGTKGNPSWFNTYAAYAESPIPASLCQRLINRGLKIDPDIFKWYHAIAQ